MNLPARYRAAGLASDAPRQIVVRIAKKKAGIGPPPRAAQSGLKLPVADSHRSVSGQAASNSAFFFTGQNLKGEQVDCRTDAALAIECKQQGSCCPCNPEHFRGQSFMLGVKAYWHEPVFCQNSGDVLAHIGAIPLLIRVDRAIVRIHVENLLDLRDNRRQLVGR